MTSLGVAGTVQGRSLRAGGPNLLRSLEVEPPEALRRAAEAASGRGQASIYLPERPNVLAPSGAYTLSTAPRPRVGPPHADRDASAHA